MFGNEINADPDIFLSPKERDPELELVCVRFLIYFCSIIAINNWIISKNNEIIFVHLLFNLLTHLRFVKLFKLIASCRFLYLSDVNFEETSKLFFF